MHFSNELLSNRLRKYVGNLVVLFLVPKIGYLDKKKSAPHQRVLCVKKRTDELQNTAKMNGRVLGIKVKSISTTQTVCPYSSIKYFKCYDARYGYKGKVIPAGIIFADTLMLD